MKKTMLAIALAVAPMSMASVAQADDTSPHSITANVGLFSQYIYRGMTYTNEDMALQGGVDYSHESGWYAGAWASSLDEDENVGNSIELDLYGGYYHEFANDFAIDVGLLLYSYPDREKYHGEDFDFTEVYLAGTWKWFTVKYSRSLTDFGGINSKSARGDGFEPNGDSRGSEYIELNFAYGLPWDMNLDLHVGHTDVKNYSQFNYTDWLVGVSKDFSIAGAEGWTAGVNYTGTDADKAWWPGADGDNRGKDHVMVYLMRTF